MENKSSPKTELLMELPKQSKKALLEILNNVGLIGAILCAVADIIFSIIFITGLQVNFEVRSVALFSCINAVIGILINVLLRWQGMKYAIIENEELCNKFFRKEAKEKKKKLRMGGWMTLNTLLDVVIKGGACAFSIFGIIYLAIEGTHNPTQLLFTLITLIMFTCFGLMNMSNAYSRYYDVQVPYMEEAIAERAALEVAAAAEAEKKTKTKTKKTRAKNATKLSNNSDSSDTGVSVHAIYSVRPDENIQGPGDSKNAIRGEAGE